jgi:hypothetical protein
MKNKIKFYFIRWREILIYYLTFKKYYLCDGCKHIHKRLKTDCDLGANYGLFVSKECYYNQMEKTCRLIKNYMLGKSKCL